MICDAHDTRRSLADVARRLGCRHRSCRTRRRRLATTEDDSAERSRFPRYPPRLLNLARRPSTRTVPFTLALRVRSVEADRRRSPVLCAFDAYLLGTAFRHSPPILKIYSSRRVYYRFSVLAVNIGTQVSSTALDVRCAADAREIRSVFTAQTCTRRIKTVERPTGLDVFWMSSKKNLVEVHALSVRNIM